MSHWSIIFVTWIKSVHGERRRSFDYWKIFSGNNIRSIIDWLTPASHWGFLCASLRLSSTKQSFCFIILSLVRLKRDLKKVIIERMWWRMWENSDVLVIFNLLQCFEGQFYWHVYTLEGFMSYRTAQLRAIHARRIFQQVILMKQKIIFYRNKWNRNDHIFTKFLKLQ